MQAREVGEDQWQRRRAAPVPARPLLKRGGEGEALAAPFPFLPLGVADDDGWRRENGGETGKFPVVFRFRT